MQRARYDPDALGRLYDNHYEKVFRYCVRRLFAREVAEDTASEVFLIVARSIRNFRGKTERDFCNWVYSIATNRINSYIRSRKRRKKLLEAAVAQRRIRIPMVVEDCDRLDWPLLYEAIASLRSKEQAVVALRAFEQLPYEQIAIALDMKATAARVTFNRALGKLRTHLEKVFGQD